MDPILTDGPPSPEDPDGFHTNTPGIRRVGPHPSLLRGWWLMVFLEDRGRSLGTESSDRNRLCHGSTSKTRNSKRTCVLESENKEK